MNVGIIGTSDISQKAIIPFQSKQFNVMAVASRDYEKAHNYMNKYNLSKCYMGYHNIFKDPEIDAVYIALPPVIQEKWIIEALENGKRVLVEKPICLSMNSLKKIQERQNDLMVLEGLMIRHHPWMKTIKGIIESGKYGRLIKSITTINMRIPSDMEKGFRSSRNLGGGVLIDEMPYWACILQETIGSGVKNISVKVKRKNGVTWKAKVFGTIQQTEVEFACSYEDAYEASQMYIFEHAKIYIPNFFRASMGNYKINIIIEQNEGKEKISFNPQNYYKNQIEFWCGNNALPTSVLHEKEKTKERVKIYEEICGMEI